MTGASRLLSVRLLELLFGDLLQVEAQARMVHPDVE